MRETLTGFVLLLWLVLMYGLDRPSRLNPWLTTGAALGLILLIWWRP